MMADPLDKVMADPLDKMMPDPLDDDSFSSDYYENDAKQIPYQSSIKNETDNCAVFQQLDMFSRGFHIMEEIRKQGTLCDVTLKVLCIVCNLISFMYDIYEVF